MGLIGLLLLIAILGLIVYLILQIPMPEAFRKAIIVLAIIFIILFIMKALGINDVAVPRLQ